MTKKMKQKKHENSPNKKKQTKYIIIQFLPSPLSGDLEFTYLK